ncbi:MAG: tetratricopeptide repeat protein, partial [Bacteroidales bacterium]|nr:tetratricopeptide repeat protein [Bacteroidales bacterium]
MMEFENKMRIIEEQLLNRLPQLIKSRAKRSLYDIHHRAETIYAGLLNLIFDWNLKNINVEEPNAKAIDLIDTEHKLIAQVSSVNTINKVQSSLDGIDTSKWADYRFLFVSISDSVDKWKTDTFKIPEGISFNPKDDCFDNNSLVSHIDAQGIDCIDAVIDYLNRTVSRIEDQCREKKFSFPIPDGLLPRNNEVEKLYNQILKNRFVNLFGIGGCGKSSLTSLMIKKHKDDFNESAYVVIDKNFKDEFVKKLNVVLNAVKDDVDNKFEKLISYLGTNFISSKINLLVIDFNDNSDCDEANKQSLQELIKTINNWTVFVVSRLAFKGFENKMDFTMIEDAVFLKKLFLKTAGKKKYGHFKQYDALFKALCHSPILVAQLGLYLHNLPMQSLDEIKTILFDENFKEEELEYRDETIIMFLRKLLDYNIFEEKGKENEKDLLRHFILWQADYIEYDVIKCLTEGVFSSEGDLKKAIVHLTKRAILTSDGNKSYKLHGLLAESLREQGVIAKEDYSKYVENIDRIVQKGNIWDTMGMCIFISYCIIGKKNTRDCNCVQFQTSSNGILSFISEFVPSFEQLKEFSIEMPQNNVDYQIMLSDLYIIFSNLYSTDYKKNLAEGYCKKAIEMIEQLSEKNHKVLDRLANAYNILASLCSTSEVAIKYNNKAINILEQLPTDNSQYQYHLACAYNRYALLHQDKYDEALDMFTKAFNIFETKLQGDSMFQLDCVNTYLNLVILQWKHCYYDEARTNCEKAIDIAQKNQFEHFLSRLALLYSYYMYAFLLECEHFHDYTLAKKYCEDMLAIGCQLPSNVPVCQFGLAMTYDRLANLLQNDYYKDYESAKMYYEKAIEIGQLLPKDNIEYQKNLANFFSYIAHLYASCLDEKVWDNKYELAEVNYHNAINIWKNMPDCQNDLASTYKSLAFLQHFRLKNKYESAEANYTNAINIWKNLPDCQNDLARTYKFLAFLQHYYMEDKYESAAANYNNAV